MPNITPYHQRTQAPVAEFGGTSRGLSQFQGVNVSGLIEGVKNVGDVLYEREEEHGRAWAADILSSARLDWTSNLNERESSATLGAPGFSQGVIADFDKYSEKLLQSAPSEKAREYVQVRMAELRTMIGERAMGFEAKARVDYRDEKFQSAISNTQKLMNTDPSQYEVALSETLAVIDSSAMPPAKRMDMHRKAIKDISTAAIWSQINKSPTQFLESIGMYSWGAGTAGGKSGDAEILPAGVPYIKNADGSISTERTITIEADGKHFVIPTIVSGKQYSVDDAIKMWRSGSNKHVGVFNTEKEANKFAEERSAAGGKFSDRPIGLMGRTGNKAFDMMEFDDRVAFLSKALSLKSGIDADADRAAARERKQMAEDSMKEALSRMYAQDGGKTLTREYVESIRPIISDTEYKSLLEGMKQAAGGGTDGAKSDPESFRQVQTLLYSSPEVAKSTALRYHKNGLLSNSDLSAALTKANELDRQGGPKTEYERTRQRIVGNLDPGPFVQDPVQRGRLAEALYAYDSWVEKNNKATDKDIAKRGQEITNQYRFIDLSESAAALPSPRFGKIPRTPADPIGMQKAIAAAFTAAKKARDEKRITQEEYLEEASLLNKWLKLTGDK